MNQISRYRHFLLEYREKHLYLFLEFDHEESPVRLLIEGPFVSIQLFVIPSSYLEGLQL